MGNELIANWDDWKIKAARRIRQVYVDLVDDSGEKTFPLAGVAEIIGEMHAAELARLTAGVPEGWRSALEELAKDDFAGSNGISIYAAASNELVRRTAIAKAALASSPLPPTQGDGVADFPEEKIERAAFEAWANKQWPNSRWPDAAWIGWLGRSMPASAPSTPAGTAMEALEPGTARDIAVEIVDLVKGGTKPLGSDPGGYAELYDMAEQIVRRRARQRRA